MKKLAFVFIALCGYAIGCSPSIDTNDPNVWARTAEPRLSGASRWAPCRKLPLEPGTIVQRVECGPPRVTSTEECTPRFLVTTRDKALHVLVAEPRCTDIAIAALASVSPDDLAAAYYIRAQRENNPVDLLRAAEAAENATPTAATLFNRALAYEALELNADAVMAWDAFLAIERASAWAEDARKRRQRLVTLDSIDEWDRDAKRLVAAVQADNRVLVAEIVRHFPTAAQKLLEEEILPDNLPGAERVAAELFRVTHDRFALDIVKAFAQTRDAASLQRGHVAFRRARLLDRAFKRDDAAKMYKEATELLARGGSPLALLSKLRSHDVAEDVATEARRRGYSGVLARAHATRAYVKAAVEHEYVEGIKEYDAAMSAYAKIRDTEGLASAHTRLIGLHRLMGDAVGAWNHAFLALRYASTQTNMQERHLLLGETAHAAMALGYPRVAVRYMNAAVVVIRRQLVRAAPEHIYVLAQLKQNLAIARRERAVVLLTLGNYSAAEKDLAEAVRLTGEGGEDDGNRRELLTRLRNVQGQALLETDPARAAGLFTEALQTAAGDQFPTFIAALRMQRAEANRLVGRHAEAEEDLKEGIAEIRREETTQLGGRARGDREELWRPYFSRFQDHSALLIRRLTTQDRHDEAFAYAERSLALTVVISPTGAARSPWTWQRARTFA